VGAISRPALTAAAALALAAPAGATTLSSVTPVAGGGSVSTLSIGSGAPYTLALDASFSAMAGLGTADGDILVTDHDAGRAFKFTPGGVIVRFAGSTLGSTCGPTADDIHYYGPADAVAFGSVYLVADSTSDHICQVDPSTGAGSTFAGTTEGWAEGGATTTAQFNAPTDLDPFSGGTSGVYVADLLNKAIRKYVSGTVSTVAGAPTNSTPPAENESTDATAADIGYPHSVSAISDTDFLLANEFQVLKVTAGKIARVAGGGTSPAADGADPKSVYLQPGGVRSLRDGGFLVTDTFQGKLLRVSGGQLSTVVGSGAVGSIALDDHALYFSDGLRAFRMAATELASAPGTFSGSTTAHFEYASWDTNATFACELDNSGVFSVCAGDYAGLAAGKHTLEVKATTDDGTRVDTPLARTWKVDLAPPDPFALGAPDAGAVLGDPRPVFHWSLASDPGGASGSGIDHYDLLLDGDKVATVAAAACAADCSANAPRTLSDGAHRWRVRAVDAVGNAQTTDERTVTVAVPPIAALTLAPSRVLAGRAVSFDASASADANGSIANYSWDLDGDGSFETDSGAAATTTKTYTSPATIDVQVRVTDGGGLTSVAQQTLVISTQAPAGKPLGVSIDDGAQYTNDPKVTIFAVWPSFASNAFVSNDGGFKNGQLFPVAEKIPWTLDSSGPERLPKTVYVRFQSGPQTSETYTDDIILDQTPPKVLSASLSSGAGAARVARAKTVTLRLEAKDNVSGVGGLQVTKNKRKPGRFLRYRKTLKVAPAKTLYVRVRDRAGNLSTWRVAKRR
jgi:hypothetical protein